MGTAVGMQSAARQRATRRWVGLLAAVVLGVLSAIVGQPAHADHEDRPVPVLNYSGTVKIGVGESITIDASKSIAPRGEKLTFYWQLDTDKAPGYLGASETGVLPLYGLTPGSHLVKVGIAAKFGASEAQVIVQVGPDPNPEAVIAPSGTQYVETGDRLLFDGAGSKRWTWGTCQWFVDGKAVDNDPKVDPGTGREETGCSVNADFNLLPRLTFRPDKAGTHTVTLRVTNGVGVSDEASVQVVVVPGGPEATVARISPDRNYIVESGRSLTFDGTKSSASDGGPLEYAWYVEANKDFPGEFASGPQLTELYGVPGKVTVRLVVTDQAGESSEASVTVTAEDNRSSCAKITDQRVDVGETVRFGGRCWLDNGGKWDLDYGSTKYSWRTTGLPGVVASTEFYSRKFDKPGRYGVQLNAVDADGHRTSKRIVVTVADATPVASFTPATDTTVKVGTRVAFDGSASSPAGALTYKWYTTGIRGVVSKTNSYARTFTKPGKYRVQLVVFTRGNAWSSKTIEVTVTGESVKPVASFTPATDTTVRAGTRVAFDGSASKDPDGGALTYKWYTTGIRGVVSKTNSYARTFTKPGKYRVQLVVIDDERDWASKTVEITVIR